MKQIFLVLLLTFVSGCASKLVDLNEPSKKSWFVLEEDIYETETRGLINMKWLVGLRKGRYELIGEDSQGLYYQGKGDTVIMLTEERANKYLETGEITPYEQRHREQFSMAGGVGGLWFPKNREKSPEIYYVLNTTPESSLMGGASAGFNASLNSPVSTGEE